MHQLLGDWCQNAVSHVTLYDKYNTKKWQITHGFMTVQMAKSWCMSNVIGRPCNTSQCRPSAKILATFVTYPAYVSTMLKCDGSTFRRRLHNHIIAWYQNSTFSTCSANIFILTTYFWQHWAANLNTVKQHGNYPGSCALASFFVVWPTMSCFADWSKCRHVTLINIEWSTCHSRPCIIKMIHVYH